LGGFWKRREFQKFYRRTNVLKVDVGIPVKFTSKVYWMYKNKKAEFIRLCLVVLGF
jgi:hypothetical protein